MSKRQPEPIPVTWEQVAAFRLSRQHLAERAPLEALTTVTGAMTGAQAQVLSAAQISLWSRIRDLSITKIDEAISARRLVRALCMRRTLFLVPADLLAVFVRGSARRAEKEIRWALGKGVPEKTLDAVIEATLDALDKPLTRPEIAAKVSGALGVQKQAIAGGGWGRQSKVAAVPIGDLTYPVVDLLMLASARGVICYGPDQDNKPTFVRAEAWIPGWIDYAQEEAESLLLRQYLRAFAPATARDFALWAGLNLTEARQIWAKEQEHIIPVDVQGWISAVLAEDRPLLTQPGIAGSPIRLLPYFDSYLLGHKDKEHLVPNEHYKKVYRAQGWIAPVVLVDGRIMGVWSHSMKKDRLTVEVSEFEPLSPGVMTGIEDEARDLGRFLMTAEVALQF